MEKTNRRVAAAIAVLTAGFLLFAGGFWAGRVQLGGGYTVTVEYRTPAPAFEPELNPLALFAKININTASAEQLEMLDGIGPKLAQRIIDYRETYGMFRYTYELLDVSGIGVSLYVRIRDSITVGSIEDV